MEIYKDINGYNGYYQISNLGNVRSLSRIDKTNHKVKEKILKPITNSYGYKVINLSVNGVMKQHHIHRLVMDAFKPNSDPQTYNQINHKDENKQNNCVDNLEWCTPIYNSNYGTRNKRISTARKNKRVA